MDGSSVLLHTLIENDLVDEYALHVYPLVLGIGKRLFPEGKKVSLKLIELYLHFRQVLSTKDINLRRNDPEKAGCSHR